MMLSKIATETMIARILNWGTLFSIVIVMVGGTLYLAKNGNQHIAPELFPLQAYDTNVLHILESVLSFSPIALIEFGLLCLVITQIIRVSILVLFYAAMQDYWFILFSGFILLVLVYSLFWRT